ncbi:MAG: hypothetical protein V4577_31525 [Bacteroidota bacterium]
MTAKTGSKALIKNPALQSFNLLIGEWQTTGTHPAVPGITLHGRSTCQWHEGGAFLIIHSEINHPDFPDGVAIFGSDDQAKTYYMLYFDERGISRKHDVSLEGDQLKWWRDDPEFSQRVSMAISGDGNKITCVGEMSRGGAAWEKDLSLTYARLA